VVDGPIVDRTDLLLNAKYDILIVNYAGLVLAMCDRVESNRKNRKTQYVVNKKRVRRLSKNIDLIALDEIQNVKNRETLAFRIINVLSKGVNHRFGATGTPIGADPADFWAEFYLIDRGNTLGQTLTLYRALFFKERKNPWSQFPEFVFDDSKRGLLNTTIQNRSLSYEDSEVHDLPTMHIIDVPIGLGEDARRYYKMVMKEAYHKERDFLGIKNIFTKARQVASSFLITEYGVLEFDYNGKIEWLVSAVKEFPVDDKFVVFHSFKYSGRAIASALKKARVKVVCLNGATKDKKKVLSQFKRNPKVKGMVVNTDSGSSGLNLQAANRVVYYETPVSVIKFMQSMKRCRRAGQTKRVYTYFLLAKNTLEAKRVQLLREGKDMVDEVVRGKEKLV